MFRTELILAPANGQLARTARVLTLGSCFADSMGTRLASFKVDALVNPFGTVFQPLALGRLLRAAAGEDVDWQQHLVQARGRWQSYDLHGSIGADSPVELLQLIQGLVASTGEFLRGADVVCLTLGTAWAYRLRETGELVSNCHKQNADLFVRELLTPDDIINGLAETHAYLRRLNPALRFVLTVSPVRHLKDTLTLNAVSKSVLRLATHILSDLLPDVAYFPAYELLTDDLRDYRFYAADMLHPSEVAEDYIWEKFARTYFDADFGRFRKEWAAVRQALGHRPLHPGAPEHRQFLESTREKLEQLKQQQIEVTAELEQVRAQLAALPVPAQPAPVAELEDDEERIDIGESDEAGSAAVPAATPSAAAEAEPAGNRPERLSPEEFRAQRAARPERGRRDGRGRGRGPQPSENEQFQTAALAVEDLQALAESRAALPELSVASDAVLADDLTPTEPASASKKKRRTRGGAKRTARKNALRLASETDIDPITPSIANPEGVLETFAAANELTVPTTQPGGRNSDNDKSQQARRRGRRDDAGRVPRAALFATPESAASPESTVEPRTDGAELTDVNADASAETSPSVIGAPVEERSAVSSSSRNGRNRNKRRGGNAASQEQETAGVAATPVSANAEPLPEFAGSETETQDRNDEPAPQPQPVAALPVSASDTAAAKATEAAPAPPEADAPAPAKQPSSRKRRAITGGRAEKPAFDTPIIPVLNANNLRTVVAAGRLMGSSATLVEPSAAPKKAKAAASKATATPVKAVAEPVASPEMSSSEENPSELKVAKAKAPKTAISKAKPPVGSPKETVAAEAPEAGANQGLEATPAASEKVLKAAKKPATTKPAAKSATKPATEPKTVKSASKPAATKQTAKAAKKPTVAAETPEAPAKVKAAPKAAAKSTVSKATTKAAAETPAAKPKATTKAATKPTVTKASAAKTTKAATPAKAAAKPAAKPKASKKPAE